MIDTIRGGYGERGDRRAWRDPPSDRVEAELSGALS